MNESLGNQSLGVREREEFLCVLVNSQDLLGDPVLHSDNL